MKKFILLLSAMLMTLMSFGAVVTFTAGTDNGNASSDSNSASAYEITKDGITLSCTNGIATYDQYRFYKNQTVTIKSTVGNITSIQFACTAEGTAKQGPGNFTWSTGDYAYSGKIGTWTGSATEVSFVTETNQVRANTVIVATDGDEIPGGGNGGGNDNDSTGTVVPPAEGVITCAQAVEICKATDTIPTTETYTIRGYVTELKEAYNSQFGNATYWMADEKGGSNQLQAYRVKPVNASDQAVKVNDYVEVVGTLVNYKGNTPEVNQGGTYTIITVGEEPEKPTLPEGLTGDGSKENPFTIEDVLTLNNQFAGPYYVKAFIVGQVNGMSISTGAEFEAPFSPSTNSDGSENTYNTNLLVASSADVADVAKCVPVQLPAGDLRTNFNLPENPEMDGQEVLICGSLVKYFGVAGIKSTSSIELLNVDTNVVNIKGVKYCEARYYEQDGAYEFMLYDFDEATEKLLFPIVLFGVEAKSKTAINGTYGVIAAMYATGVNADEEPEGILMAEDAEGTLTIKNVDEEGNYSFVGSFVGEDGKTYKVNQVVNVYALDDATEEGIELDENATAVEHITAGTAKAVKVIIDGKMLIQEGGKFYNVLGVEVK